VKTEVKGIHRLFGVSEISAKIGTNSILAPGVPVLSADGTTSNSLLWSLQIS
jgi:hypothetical protein